jgi:hypothetical protein
MDEASARWNLISVLMSTVPLTSSLATSLYEVARGLHRSGEDAGELYDEGVEGKVRNLRRAFSLGAIAGPGFEADLETKEGRGRVRFLVTREGLERGRRRDRLDASLRN